jgi:DNA-binding winged helix-turn-helix (wHTH) protein
LAAARSTILAALTERDGETISKEELIARAWPDTVVEEAALRVHVAALRKALGDGRAGKRYIANFSGRGYAFIATVTRENAPSAPVAPNGTADGGKSVHTAHATASVNLTRGALGNPRRGAYNRGP